LLLKSITTYIAHFDKNLNDAVRRQKNLSINLTFNCKNFELHLAPVITGERTLQLVHYSTLMPHTHKKKKNKLREATTAST